MSYRITIVIVVISAMFAQGVTVLADNNGKPSDQSNENASNSNRSLNIRKFSGLQPINGWQQLTGKLQGIHCNDHYKEDIRPLPVDPGRGDGKPTGSNQPLVIADPVPVKAGYVWVNGHWERQKATQGTSSGPTLVSGSSIPPAVQRPQVIPSSSFNGFNIRDHRTSTPGFRGAIRDHRHNSSSSAPGGVTVTVSKGSSRNNTIPTLTGPGPLDALGNAAQSIGSGLKDLVTTEVGEAPVIRDHRTQTFPGIVRDHR